MKDEQQLIRNRIRIFILAGIAFVITIIALSVIITTLQNNDYGIKIINKEDIKKDNIVDEGDLTRARQELRKILTKYYNVPENEPIEASIRESSYYEERASSNKESEVMVNFLMDVENNKASYWVFIIHNSEAPYAISLNCASNKESKYPDTFCIGTNNNSSIDANIKDLFPYRKIVNGEQKFIVTHPQHEHSLLLGVDANCDDSTAEQSALKEIKDIIKERGMNPDQIEIVIDKTECQAYQDETSRPHE